MVVCGHRTGSTNSGVGEHLPGKHTKEVIRDRSAWRVRRPKPVRDGEEGKVNPVRSVATFWENIYVFERVEVSRG